ncbi:MAG: hypothetical protein WCK10_00635 [Candidatus Staskawiczbacteria bacterium]
METSEKNNILMVWLRWHFLEVPNFLLGVWKNYILFALNYFSVPLLLKSLFSPWHRYRWNYPRGFDIGEFFTTLISNTFSRFLGALMRIILIIVGLIFQIFVILFGSIIFLLWVFIPFIVIAGLIFIFIN